MLADIQTNGRGRFCTASHLIGIVLLQHHLLQRFQRVAGIVFGKQGVEALIAVCSFTPPVGNRQIVNSQNTAIGSLTKAGFLEVLVSLGGLLFLIQPFQGNGPIDVVACPLLVGIVVVIVATLLILANQFSVTLCPLERLLEIMSLVAVVGNIDNTRNRVLKRLIGATFLNVLDVHLVSSVVRLVSLVGRHTETRLATTDINQEVRIVARRVALQLFQPFGRRNSYIQGCLILATDTQHIGQTAG